MLRFLANSYKHEYIENVYFPYICLKGSSECIVILCLSRRMHTLNDMLSWKKTDKWLVDQSHSDMPDNQSCRHAGPGFIKPDQLDPWIKDQLRNALLSTILSLQLQGLSLPHDTKFGNRRGEMFDRRVIFIWTLIHGSSWSGLKKVGPGWIK